MTAIVFYLQWHRNDSERNYEATELFHEFHHLPPDGLSEELFNRLYEQVTEVEDVDLEGLWNATRRAHDDRDNILDPDVRRLCIGDIVEKEESHYAVTPKGWRPISITSE
jgi:hypothetical protein